MKSLRKRRKSLGLTQLALGGDAGIDRSKISMIERGEASSSQAEAELIERALLATLHKRLLQFENVMESYSEHRSAPIAELVEPKKTTV